MESTGPSDVGASGASGAAVVGASPGSADVTRAAVRPPAVAGLGAGEAALPQASPGGATAAVMAANETSLFQVRPHVLDTARVMTSCELQQYQQVHTLEEGRSLVLVGPTAVQAVYLPGALLRAYGPEELERWLGCNLCTMWAGEVVPPPAPPPMCYMLGQCGAGDCPAVGQRMGWAGQQWCAPGKVLLVDDAPRKHANAAISAAGLPQCTVHVQHHLHSYAAACRPLPLHLRPCIGAQWAERSPAGLLVSAKHRCCVIRRSHMHATSCMAGVASVPLAWLVTITQEVAPSHKLV